MSMPCRSSRTTRVRRSRCAWSTRILGEQGEIVTAATIIFPAPSRSARSRRSRRTVISNEYWGWGKEDDDFFFRLLLAGYLCYFDSARHVPRSAESRRISRSARAAAPPHVRQQPPAPQSLLRGWRIPPKTGSAPCKLQVLEHAASTPTTKRSACVGEACPRTAHRDHMHELLVRLPSLVRRGAAVPRAGRAASSPYLPLNLSPEIERQIERVLILADKPVTVAADRRRHGARCVARRVPHRSRCSVRPRAPLPRALHAQARR